MLASLAIAGAQDFIGASKIAKPRIKEVQIPYTSIKPTITIKIGGTADWILVTEGAVWVASTKPFAVLRIDPATNKVVASIKISGEACSGLALGFGSIWAPICGKKPALVRIDAAKNALKATIPVSPAGPGGGIAASDDSVWLVTDQNGTLVRNRSVHEQRAPENLNPTRLLQSGF